MFTPEVQQPKVDYFDHFAPSMMASNVNSLVSSTYLSPTPSNYSDPGSYQQSPMSIYNNYNPNYHHHHYYFHANFPDYGYNQQTNASFHDNGSNWMRKYDYESQKEYFIANTPPSECYDFEVPQRISPSPKPTTTKLFHELDKIFFDEQHENKVKCQVNNNPTNMCEAYSFWDEGSEKLTKKIGKTKEKFKSENAGKVDGRVNRAGVKVANLSEGL